MSDQFWTAFPLTVAAVGGIVTTVLGFVNNSIARRAAERSARNERHLQETKDAIVTLEKNTNSIKDALVKVTGESEFAKGLKQGTEEGKK